MTIRRGDILWADLGMFPTTSVQGGVRPVIVVSNNKANTYSSVITVVPLTSRIYKKRYLPTHVFISKYDMTGIRKGSLALAEQVRVHAAGGLRRAQGERIGQRANRLGNLLHRREVCGHGRRIRTIFRLFRFFEPHRRAGRTPHPAPLRRQKRRVQAVARRAFWTGENHERHGRLHSRNVLVYCTVCRRRAQDPPAGNRSFAHEVDSLSCFEPCAHAAGDLSLIHI